MTRRSSTKRRLNSCSRGRLRADGCEVATPLSTRSSDGAAAATTRTRTSRISSSASEVASTKNPPIAYYGLRSRSKRRTRPELARNKRRCFDADLAEGSRRSIKQVRKFLSRTLECEEVLLLKPGCGTARCVPRRNIQIPLEMELYVCPCCMWRVIRSANSIADMPLGWGRRVPHAYSRTP